MSRFLDGGIDTVLVEYIRHLAQDERYHITLAIATYMGKLEVFLPRIPKSVSIVYFNRASFLSSIPQKRVTKTASGMLKLLDEVVINPIRRRNNQKGINHLAKIADVFIDFDCCAYSFLKSISNRKIVFYHFSFEQTMQQNQKRMKRIGKQLDHYDTIVTISEAMREEGCKMFPHLKDKMIVMYNAKDQEAIRKRSNEICTDERIHQSYLLAVERLEESQKDITTLLQAFAILRQKRGIKEKLYIIGKGNSEGQLKQLAKDLRIADAVEFIGFTSNPYPWIKQSSLLVHSAKFEGLPTVLIEGLMLDKLMVASDCPTGPREILDNGQAGLLVPVGDAPAFADAIYQLLTDSSMQQQMHEGVTKRAIDFTFQTIDHQLLQII